MDRTGLTSSVPNRQGRFARKVADKEYSFVTIREETEELQRKRKVLSVFAYALELTAEAKNLTNGPDEKATDTILDKLAKIGFFIPEEKYYWLYHWFGFGKIHVVNQPASDRAAKAPLATISSSEEAHNKRVAWARILLFTLHKQSAFRKFADNKARVSALRDMFMTAYLDEGSRNVPIQVILSLSSTFPGVLTAAYAASPAKITLARFYLDADDSFWASLDEVPTQFTLDDVLTYQPPESVFEKK